MLQVGFVGWRGMVGSVLLERMLAENDFVGCRPLFFSTSQVGGGGPNIGVALPSLQDAFNLSKLGELDVIVSCQGGDYTSAVYPQLRAAGWSGYWIDAASTLRMEADSVIVLDPVNRELMDQGLRAGVKNFIGGNCTVSLMLLAVSGLLQSGYVEWIATMTYQAASGAGANNMRELVQQMGMIGQVAAKAAADPATAILDLDRQVLAAMQSVDFPVKHFGAPLAGSLIPWIDRPVADGQTREEWKGEVEANKILGLTKKLPVDGLCVRVGALRCHSQALTIKLTEELPLPEVERLLAEGNKWVEVVPNTKEETLRRLSPAAVSGTLRVPIGRLRYLKLGTGYLGAFTVGDQLLWGAAEPVRRALKIVREYLGAGS